VAACGGGARIDASVPTPIRIDALASLNAPAIAGLGDVLIDCVEGGASVSFMLPMTRAKAEAYWEGVAASVARGECLVLAAYDAAGVITGTVQVLLRQPENQPHRADIAKMLVHRRARRQGLGAQLLAAAESAAVRAGKTLLVLDTASVDAQRLYARVGWQRVGQIPDYALWPGGGSCATTVFYKRIGAAAPEAEN
jgi:ribosomal protein S18 acetylase RimI-like enzyme